MDLSEFKEALGDEKFTKLESYVKDLIGQRDTARNESIEKRKGLKAKVEALEGLKADLFEKLGISDAEELEDLDIQGQAEAAKQFEARIKRLEKEAGEKDKRYSTLETKHTGMVQEAAMRKAAAKHEFVDMDLVAAYVKPRLVQEEDKLLYRTESGGVVDLAEGLDTLAKEKPHLLKASGAGGSGYRGSGAGGSEKNPWAKETRNLTEQGRITRENPQLAAELKAQAKAA